MRRAGFSPALSLLIPAFSLACAPAILTVDLHRCMRRSSTACQRQARCFGTPLIPDHLRRRPARPVSYYALFKWWLLLSQHPGCHRRITSSRTRSGLGTLAGDLGCSPLDDEAYPPPSICRAIHVGIRSLVSKGSRVGPLSNSVALPPANTWRR